MISIKTTTPTEGMVTTMFVNKFRFATALVLAIVVVIFGMSTALLRSVPADETAAKAEKESKSGSATEAAAPKQTDPPKLLRPDPATTIAVGDVTYRLPFALPSGQEILEALPAKAGPMNARIQCELLEYRLDGPRMYPGEGRACLAKAHFKCTVFADKSSEVVYIDRNFLFAEKTAR
jgi:hypothetical protein